MRTCLAARCEQMCCAAALCFCPATPPNAERPSVLPACGSCGSGRTVRWLRERRMGLLGQVARVIKAMGAKSWDPVPRPKDHYLGSGGTTLTLSEALAACYDLRSPRPELLLVLQRKAGASGAPQLTAALAEGSDPAKAPSLAAWLAERHVADVLAVAPSVRLTAADLLPCLRQLQPRLYSISSSPLEATGRVCITVAVVRYASLGAPRVGVCSTYTAERLAVGATAPVYVTKNPDFRLPPSLATPIIMVGPGTGLAPFRAFIHHRLALAAAAGLAPATAKASAKGAAKGAKAAAKAAAGGSEHANGAENGSAEGSLGAAVLYFGCRHQAKDYLYGQQLEAWSKDGTLELHTAFSRDGKGKVYVQQRLAETAPRVWELLQASRASSSIVLCPTGAHGSPLKCRRRAACVRFSAAAPGTPHGACAYDVVLRLAGMLPLVRPA